MCKNWENGAKSAWATSAGVHNCLPVRPLACALAGDYNSGTGQSRANLGAWPIVLDAGPSQALPRRRRRRGANAEGARTEPPRGVRPAGKTLECDIGGGLA